MKKTVRIFLSGLFLLPSLYGCLQIEPQEEPVAATNLLTAILENQAETRSQLGLTEDNKYFAFWTAKDELAVYVDDLHTPDRYVLSEGAGTRTGTFTGTVSGLHYIALYPYSDLGQNGVHDNVLELVLPSEQHYAPDSFGEGAFPIIAVSEDSELIFKNLCAVLKISLTGSGAVKAIRFTAKDSKMAVSGPATVRTDFAEMPELVMKEGGTPSVTLACEYVQLSEDNARDFFIVLPAGTYKGGFTLEIETFSGVFTRTVASDVTFLRSQFRYIAPFQCETDGQIDPDDIPHNQIWYTTSYGRTLGLQKNSFDKNVISHTYTDGKGVITFDGPVTHIGPNAFWGQSLTGIYLPNSIESIGDYAFAYSAINSFRTPKNLSSMGESVFNHNENLARIYGPLASADERALILPDGTLAAYALGALEPVLTIPDGATSIAPYLFEGQGQIRDIILPEGLLSIRGYCFSNCANLETVSFPESITQVDDGVFADCHLLREFKGNKERVPDGRAFVSADGAMNAFAGAGIQDYVLPDNVRTFGSGTFKNQKSLHSLTFPRLSFSTIWVTDYFSGCDNLEFFYGEGTTEDHHGLIIWGDYLFAVTHILPRRYTFPEGYGITRTNGDLFADNTTTEHITLPDDMLSTGAYMFYNMSRLRSVRMPANLVVMGSNAFQKTPSLDTLYMRSFTPPSYSEWDSFAHEGLVIYVPEGSEEQYKSAETWSKYAQYIRGYHYDDLDEPDYYISSDYSKDGVVTTLQKATEGHGIDIVLLGDAFSDRQIADGTYRSVMDKMADAFFMEEPYRSYRNLFNVYAVNVVSASEGYEHPGQALGGWFGDGTTVGGIDDRCKQYARRVIPDDRMDNALIIVAMNSPKYAGTCYMYDPFGGDYSCGLSVAYFPIGEDDEGLAQLVHHEAGGHGFAKLADEYAYESNGTIPQSEKASREVNVPYGWWKNADFTNDPATVKWSHFLTDVRYQYDGLGCFEGAFTYWKGAWRPTESSIMRHNTGGFNAPSREAIWYRIHKLAYGDGWNYNYEEFVAYDAINRKTSASTSSIRRSKIERTYPQTAPPVVIHRKWNEPAPESRPLVEKR